MSLCTACSLKKVTNSYPAIKQYGIKNEVSRYLPEGTHGTSGWMNKSELLDALVKGPLDTLDETLFGKLENGEYVSLKDTRGMNKNIIIYGSPGTGKSRGFVMPLQCKQ